PIACARWGAPAGRWQPRCWVDSSPPVRTPGTALVRRFVYAPGAGGARFVADIDRRPLRQGRLFARAPGAACFRLAAGVRAGLFLGRRQGDRDRKSTRLNSSHGSISYAVFCLKKKKRDEIITY